MNRIPALDPKPLHDPPPTLAEYDPRPGARPKPRPQPPAELPPGGKPPPAATPVQVRCPPAPLLPPPTPTGATIMTQPAASSSSSPVANLALTFLAGAALGALLVALVTPKSGPELRGELKDLTNRARRKAADWSGMAFGRGEAMPERACQAAGDLKRGVAEAMNDLGV